VIELKKVDGVVAEDPVTDERILSQLLSRKASVATAGGKRFGERWGARDVE